MSNVQAQKDREGAVAGTSELIRESMDKTDAGRWRRFSSWGAGSIEGMEQSYNKGNSHEDLKSIPRKKSDRDLKLAARGDWRTGMAELLACPLLDRGYPVGFATAESAQ